MKNVKNKTDPAVKKIIALMIAEILDKGVSFIDLEIAIYKALGIEKEIEQTPF